MKELNTFIINDFATQTGVSGRDFNEALSGKIFFTSKQSIDYKLHKSCQIY
jgi:hypothetical protein